MTCFNVPPIGNWRLKRAVNWRLKRAVNWRLKRAVNWRLKRAVNWRLKRAVYWRLKRAVNWQNINFRRQLPIGGTFRTPQYFIDFQCVANIFYIKKHNFT